MKLLILVLATIALGACGNVEEQQKLSELETLPECTDWSDSTGLGVIIYGGDAISTDKCQKPKALLHCSEIEGSASWEISVRVFADTQNEEHFIAESTEAAERFMEDRCSEENQAQLARSLQPYRTISLIGYLDGFMPDPIPEKVAVYKIKSCSEPLEKIFETDEIEFSDFSECTRRKVAYLNID